MNAPRPMALVLLALCPLLASVHARAPRSIEPPPPRALWSRAHSAPCASCHRAQTEQWRRSQHARAWRDPVFLAAYREEPMAFCRGCHAPLGDPAREPDALAQDEGVSCASCHALAAEHARRGGRGPATERMASDSSGGCARCHQFDFVADRGHGRSLWPAGEPMQNTAREWHRWSAQRPADERASCVSCHMPAGDHRVRGVEDPAFLARSVAVDARACREATRWNVTVTVEATRVGHAVPTGDLHRELRLVVTGEGPGAERAHRFARQFETRLEQDTDGRSFFVRRERFDGRLSAPGLDPAQVIELEIPARAGDAPPRWRLEHWRTARSIAERQGLAREQIVTTLAEGVARPCAPR